MEAQTQHRYSTTTRLRFVLGTKATEVALPSDATLTDLLPAVLPQFGAEWIEQGADHEGWVVQRIGSPPLDEDKTLAELNLLDGESLYLRPRSDQLPPIDYDDLVAGVGEQVRDHRLAWRPPHTRWLFRLAAAAALLYGLLALADLQDPAITAVVALTFPVVLLIAAALLARTLAVPISATILTGVAACCAFVGGLALTESVAPLAEKHTMATVGFAITLLVLFIGRYAVADGALLFVGAILFTALLLVTGFVAAVAPLSTHQAAGIGLFICLVVSVFVPATSFRLSGLTLPLLPTDAPELSEEIDPVPAQMVVDRSKVVFGYSMAMHVGLGAAMSLLLPELVGNGDGWATALSLVIGALLGIRTRHPNGVVQRWAVVVPAVVAVVVNVEKYAAELTDVEMLVAVALPLVLVSGVMLLFSKVMPGRRHRPYWGRALEILESLTAIAVVPLLLQVLGVYGWMRGLAG
ncbi:MAG: type VII secretion integral membrane protein EccD [Thermocrispum agreste]|uniref:Type VII secretion integral membrane protein EccD n=1 Tax=Thermocrispum agreste TaxID=37925 RepID=A0ABD6FFA2_9PSEU